jgi:isopentenyl-diphosphate Delta-isomerase
MSWLPLERSPADPRASTSARKADHLRINVERDVAGKGVRNGFDEYRLIHQALPEIDLSDVDPSAELFGRPMRAPLLISCMTGGTVQAGEINRRLAHVAQTFGLGLGLGSGRVLIESQETLPSFDVRDDAPNVPLLANVGAVQLNKGYTVDHCRRLMDLLRADALVLHLNALQEALQPEGDTAFSGLLGKIEALCAHAEFPVAVKEVGWGIAPDGVRDLFDAGVSAVDLAGAGGTSWSEVERHRIDEPWRERVAAAFAGWGIPTAECLRLAREIAPSQTIIASGGIRDGIDAVKALALGADVVGIAGGFLRAAASGTQEALDFARELVEVVRIAMFSLGTPTLNELRGTRRIAKADLPLLPKRRSDAGP